LRHVQAAGQLRSAFFKPDSGQDFIGNLGSGMLGLALAAKTCPTVTFSRTVSSFSGRTTW